ASAAAQLAAEARWLDHERWRDWLSHCCDDTVVWVPLDTRSPHPGDDQSLFLDDRRRLDERVWRFLDPNAWALVPSGTVVRSVSGVEAWPAGPDELVVSSVLGLQQVRAHRTWATTGRQVHRLRAVPRTEGGTAYLLVHKIMLLPHLEAGSPHLGWLL
ncbi:MAG: aromatic-ring-hydroxylating dioxygenase subunit beta, partial [Nocardioides sp.]|uniref:aromatic-ring-hydroxylating dioxygenase subunit beta n=1 Tax=Nocardioides sp. TaxID=35761 RepID=UPI0039E62F56